MFLCDLCVKAPANRGKKRESCSQKYTVHLMFVIIFLIHGWFIYSTALPFYEYLGYTILIISTILFIIAVGYFLASACTDPGIIPPATEEEAIVCVPQFDVKKPIQNKILEIKGQTFAIRFCPTCYMYRPPRVSHCSSCNVCVENFDHHCPYIGNCVGRRNYRRFIAFLFFLTIYNCFILASVLSMFLIDIDRDQKGNAFCLFITTIFLASGLYPLAGLTGYHFFLIMASMTTNEDIKDTFLVNKEKSFELVENPYTTGSPCLNIWLALCSPVPPTKLNAKTSKS